MRHYLLIWILWPSFLVAGMAEGLLFTVVHPQDLLFFGHDPDVSDEAIYTIGFFIIWAFCAVSSTLTAYILPGIEASESKETDHGLL
jgi:hypothetical protein